MQWWCILTSTLGLVGSAVALLLAYRRVRLPSTLRTLVSEQQAEMSDLRAAFEKLVLSHKKLRNSEEMAARRAAIRGLAADATSVSPSEASDAQPVRFNGAGSKSAWRKKRGVPENPMDWPKWNLQQQGRKQ